MKFILIIVLMGPGQPTIATAEFDDLAACENAKVLTIPLVNPRANVNAQCFPKATAKK